MCGEGGEEDGQRTEHGRKENGCGEVDVALHAESLVREEILLDHLATHEELQRERREHVQAKTYPCNIDQGVVLENANFVSHPTLNARKLTGEKLLRMLPCVRSVNTTYPEMAIVAQATNDNAVDTCVTVANRSSVGVFKLP